MGESERRRRRLRKPLPAGADAEPDEGGARRGPQRGGGEAFADTARVHDSDTGDLNAPVNAEVGSRSRTPPGSPEDRDVERGLRGLVGSGTSQVSNAAALRARDSSRPSAEDLAAAEQGLVIIKRGWVPHEELPRR